MDNGNCMSFQPAPMVYQISLNITSFASLTTGSRHVDTSKPFNLQLRRLQIMANIYFWTLVSSARPLVTSLVQVTKRIVFWNHLMDTTHISLLLTSVVAMSECSFASQRALQMKSYLPSSKKNRLSFGDHICCDQCGEISHL